MTKNYNKLKNKINPTCILPFAKGEDEGGVLIL